MAILTVNNIQQSFGEEVILQEVTFELQKGERVGLVGVNGSGKTTLFKVLTGEYSPDTGSVTFGKDTVLGYMEQHVCRDFHKTAFDEVMTVFAPLLRLERELEDVTALLAEHPNYIALSYLRGEAVGYVRMEEEALTPDDCGHIGAMYIVPDLRGNCYAEQLFGYAAHEFRYGGKRIVTMALPVLPEERRIAERFLFTRMQGSADRIALALFSPPSPYPILA